MSKFTFLVYHREYPDFLENIRKIGVVHIIQSEERDNPEYRQHFVLMKGISDTIKFLKKRNIEPVQHTSQKNGEEIYKEIVLLQAQADKKQKQLKELHKELSIVKPWGDFSVSTLKEIDRSGIQLQLFVCTEKKFNNDWLKQPNIFIINQTSGLVYFVLLGEAPDSIEIDADKIQVPENSLSDLQSKIEILNNEIEKIEFQFNEYASNSITALTEFKQQIEELSDLQLILLNTYKEADEKVMLIEGWVPKTEEAELLKFLNEKKLLFISKEAEADDKVPILLKNNRFATLFEPISKLFSLPSYNELDLTPLFAPFFMMFFGFCLGDAGYGVVILILATIASFKVKKDVKPFIRLAQFFSLGTIFFGIVSGTLFGINLLEAKIPALEGFKSYMLDTQGMFNLALILGVVQILFGLGVKIVNQTRQSGWQYGMSSLGWIILVVSLLDKYLLQITPIGLYAALIGVLLILFFNDPKANIFVRIGKGIWELYGITGIFGDVLSYIRLFALGTSGAILGYVINDIALQVKNIPYVGWIIFIILLIVGHIANILISSLGAFVHPMRLTFVEFYKNAGFAGGGKAYNPFRKKTKHK